MTIPGHPDFTAAGDPARPAMLHPAACASDVVTGIVTLTIRRGTSGQFGNETRPLLPLSGRTLGPGCVCWS
jgi:hypothetical protein